SASTLVGMLSVAVMQKLKLWDPVVLAWLGGFGALLACFIYALSGMPSAQLSALSSLLGNLILFGIIMVFVIAGAVKKIPVYECFVEGAKQGFEVSKNLLPYLVAMLCAVGVLRASGVLDYALEGLRWLASSAHLDTRFVDAMPTALVKPLSGSAARAL